MYIASYRVIPITVVSALYVCVKHKYSELSK